MGEREDNTVVTSGDPAPEVHAAIRKALSLFPCSWHVHLQKHLAGGWWALTLSCEGFRKVLLLSPGEQGPTEVTRQVEAALATLREPRPRVDPPPPWDGRERRSRPRS